VSVRTPTAPPLERPAPPVAPVVTRVGVRLVRRGTAVVAGVCAVLPAIVVVQYPGMADLLGSDSLARLAESPAIRTLFGPPVALGDPGGFTVWRTGTVLAVLAGVWAALTATRITRGEEEAGRWDLLLAGRTGLRSLVLQSLIVALGAAALIGAAVAAGLFSAGAEPAGSVLFGAVIGGTGMVGAAVGVLAAQVLPDRHSASGLAVGVLLTGLLLRMVADGVPALTWLHWASPFGLLGRVAPFAGDRAQPLLVLAALVAAASVAAVLLVGDRDTGAGRLVGPDAVRPRGRPLTSLPAFAIRRTRRPLLTWGLGIAAYFLLIGLLATSLSEFLRDNPMFVKMAAAAGFANLVTVEGYVAAIFALLAVPIGGFASGRVAATVADETSGRLALLLSGPVGRVRWALTETAAVATAAVLLAAIAALATWAGTAAVGAPLSLAEALAGTLSVVPVALLCLGAALAALGWAPQAVVAVGILPAAGGYLLMVFAQTFRWPHWVLELSPFAHLAAVPAEPLDVAGVLGLLVVAGLAGGVGVARYARRDLRG
jgi:ABC-2 type transport system permease protein